MPVLDMRQVLGETELDEYAAERRQELEDAVPWVNLLLEVRNGAAGSWSDSAACAGQTGVMFPERGVSNDPARALCASCPVIDECREWSESYGRTLKGVVAGESERGRRVRRLGASDDAAAAA